MLITEIWQDILRVEHVGVRENFLDLGGHSLLIMQVISRLEKHVGVRLHPAELFTQTLGQLANMCEERKPAAFAPEEDLQPAAASQNFVQRLLGLARPSRWTKPTGHV